MQGFLKSQIKAVGFCQHLHDESVVLTLHQAKPSTSTLDRRCVDSHKELTQPPIKAGSDIRALPISFQFLCKSQFVPPCSARKRVSQLSLLPERDQQKEAVHRLGSTILSITSSEIYLLGFSAFDICFLHMPLLHPFLHHRSILIVEKTVRLIY